MRTKRPTLRDVALHAGVSFKTVSRVVNGEPGVSEAVVTRVAEAITALDYQPDDRARNLRRTDSRTGAIGFVLVDVANPFFSSILRGIEEVARGHGYLVLSGSSDGDPEREHDLIEAFIARRVDGLILVSSGTSSGPVRREIDRGTPVVFLDLEPTERAGDLVRSDHQGGAALATQHLLAQGHRSIMFFGDDPAIFSARLRLDGYRDAMQAAGVEPDDSMIVTGHHNADEWTTIIETHLSTSPPPTAILTAQNFVSVGGARALRRLGMHRTIAQVGFDEVDWADLVEPGLTVVPQFPTHLGERAADLLFARVGGHGGPVVTEITPATLIERGSGEIRPMPEGR